MYRGLQAKTQFWDTAGQKENSTKEPSFLALIKGAGGIIIVYDVSNLASFKNIEDEYIPLQGQTNVESTKLLLIGTKSDCEREVS